MNKVSKTFIVIEMTQMYMSVLPACMQVRCIHAWYLQKPETVADTVELELAILVSCYAGAGSQIQVFCNCS